jgi:dienelactone hydrolase
VSGSTTAGARVAVEPARALVDDEVAVRLEGFTPGSAVVVESSTVDEAGLEWTSRGLFRVDANGAVDLATQAPVEGTWAAADPMGFLWSMALAPGTPSQRYQQSELRPATVAITATEEGRAVARAELERVFVAPGVTRTDVRDDGLVATLYQPLHRGGTAVLVVGGSAGGLENARAAALASRGFPALTLAYFGVDPLPRALVGIEIEYFERALRWMAARGLGDGGRLALMGTSRGGELALLLATRHPDLAAVIAYVPSGLVHGGIAGPGGDPSARPAAWTLAGRPLASAPMAFERIDFRARPLRFAPGFLGGLENRAAVEAARIPVERIQAPVLLFSGKDDQLWPSPVLAAIAEQGLVASRRVEHVAYDGAGHNIGHPYLPSTTHSMVHPLNGMEIALGGTDAGDAFARRDSWRRALELLSEV